MEKRSFCYILASKRNGTLYVGVTSDLLRRVYKHKSDFLDGFTKKYQVHQLVWYEQHLDIREAMYRERQIKKWNREWKLRLIESVNPAWKDLYLELTGAESPAFTLPTNYCRLAREGGHPEAKTRSGDQSGSSGQPLDARFRGQGDCAKSAEALPCAS